MRALKPGYDSFAVQGVLIQSVCDFFGRTFDDSEAKRHASLRGHRPYDDYWCEVMGENPTLNETARHFHMTPAKVRKILITGGRFDTSNAALTRVFCFHVISGPHKHSAGRPTLLILVKV